MREKFKSMFTSLPNSMLTIGKDIVGGKCEWLEMFLFIPLGINFPLNSIYMHLLLNCNRGTIRQLLFMLTGCEGLGKVIEIAVGFIN
jgi:hypothetical protein